MSDAEEFTDPATSSAAAELVGERSAGDGRESSHEDSADVTTDDDVDDLPDQQQQQLSASASDTAAGAAATVIASHLVIHNAQSSPSKASSSSTTSSLTSPHTQKNNSQENPNNATGNVGVLPWGAKKEVPAAISAQLAETNLSPGEYVMRTLFAEFTISVENKIDLIMEEPLERSLSKCLQRGEDAKFDQLVMAFGSVAEHCLPSLLRALFDWYGRQGVQDWSSVDAKARPDPSKNKLLESSNGAYVAERRDLAVDFILCLVLIEVLKQLPVHPGHDQLVHNIEDLAFRHFRHRENLQNNPNCLNINVVADLYAEVVGVLAQSRFQSVRRRFMHELKELRGKEQSAHTTHNITTLLMGMKFFRVKMVPIEEFEASFQFMQECAQYFIEVRDKDIKHALAGLFVEILVPVAAAVKNEVNVPCLKNFVDMLYSSTLDTATKNKHKLAIFPLLTCLLCVSTKTFFLSNWHYFLTMCLQHLKSRDPKMARVALESLYRLLWVYMIRIKCESNSATHSRLASIVNSLFPKGSKTVVPRDTPLNIFVKIIQFIAQERLDFAMRDIVFDLLSVGRPIKVILSPERMSIGLRAFLVVADSLQQKEGDPPMPRTLGVMPSGNTLRVKKTFLNKMLTEDTARNIGLAAYYPLVRKAFNDILKALDTQFGRPLMMTNTHNVNKEPDELIGGERKTKMDLLRTCVAAVPRLLPDGMSGQELVELLSRLTVHMDEELRALAFISLQSLVVDFPEWRHEVIFGFIQFINREVGDSFPQLVDASQRMLLQLLTAWRTAASTTSASSTVAASIAARASPHLQHLQLRQRGDDLDVICLAEASCLLMLCACRSSPRRLAVLMLKELKALAMSLNAPPHHMPLIDVLDKFCGAVVEDVAILVAANERFTLGNNAAVDMQWLAERTAVVWTGSTSTDSDKTSQQPQPVPEDVWPKVLLGFLEPSRVLAMCPRVVSHTWPLVFTRASNLYPTIDPLQPNENRASLLRSATTLKKPVCERELYLNLWRNYVVLACRVVPLYSTGQHTGSAGPTSLSSTSAVSSTPITQRCASPDISVGSSPDSGTQAIGGGGAGSSVAPPQLYKLLVPLLRCDLTEVRDVASLALGNINHCALGDVMEELVPLLRESLDRKQENMRRRRRRDILRVQLMKLFNAAASAGTFALSESVLDSDSGALLKHYLDYLDGARSYLESDADRDNVLLMQIKLLFCKFVHRLIKGFTLDQQMTLVPRNIRRGLFNMFSSWSGAYGSHFGYKSIESGSNEELELCALEASVAVLCCGPAYASNLLSEDASIYQWLDALLNSENAQVCRLGHEAVVLLLEFNPDCGALLDWLVDTCYTAEPQVREDCFSALATIFSAREYPCDRYTAIMTVSLLYTACPRMHVQETALQLLQILDSRFFGTSSLSTLGGTLSQLSGLCSTLDVFLSGTYSRCHHYLSKQLAHLHPELTMPIFSEVSSRLQTARSCVRQLLFSCLLPWLYNMELVDPSLPPANYPYSGNGANGAFFSDNAVGGLRREGWGSVEATEMVLNNLFYITAKFGEEHPKEVEELWGALCSCWPNNLRVIIRYLLIVVGMAPNHLLPHAQRVAVSIGRARPDRLVEELMQEMGCVETLCLIERTETPPFYRLTAVRKCSGGQDENGGATGGDRTGDAGADTNESGTLHTKRHSGDHHEPVPPSLHGAREQRSAPSSLRSASSLGSGVSSVIEAPHTITAAQHLSRTSRPTSSLAPNSAATSNNMEDSTCDEAGGEDNFTLLRRYQQQDAAASAQQQSSFEGIEQPFGCYEPPQPHPLPMPEYGGYFAPLTEYLPDSSQPITAFHRCYLSVLMMCEVLVAGIDADCHSVDWSVHVPHMLHIIVLGLDHARPIVHQHCKRLLIHVLTVVGDHRDHLGIARVLLNRKTCSLGYKLIPHNTFQHSMAFTESAPFSSTGSGEVPLSSSNKAIQQLSSEFSGSLEDSSRARGSALSAAVPDSDNVAASTTTADAELSDEEVPNVGVSKSPDASGGITVVPDELQHKVKALIDFLAASDGLPLWNYEDITPKQLSIRSAQQLANFVHHVVAVLSESLPHSHLEERLAQIALHFALTCSSRHYAGRSLQVLRCLHVSLSSRMLSELLGRLVETVAEQGEDMQGYVTELMLTLEAAVDALHSDFRPIEFVRELFKSTPNLNKDRSKSGVGSGLVFSGPFIPGHHPHRLGPPPSGYAMMTSSPGHLRSTSFSISYARGKHITSPTTDLRGTCEMRGRSCTDADARLRLQQQQLHVNSNLSRSRSAQSLKMLADQSNDDKLAVLAQLFWIAVSLLESDYDYEFLLATRLLDKVLSRLPLDRPDALDKLEKLQHQLKWRNFVGVHSLLLKGCTSPTLYEPAVTLLARLSRYTHLQVVDPSPSRTAFAMNVIALLPYMLHHYEDANDLCIQAAENIAAVSQECSDEGKQLQNLATVMTLYSRRNFSKESFQWTKCVVKYLHDSYTSQAQAQLAFLVEILEKGPLWAQSPVLSIIYCLLHYTDMNSPSHFASLNADLLSVIAKYMEGVHWRESLRILKLAVTSSSTLSLPPRTVLRSDGLSASSPTRSIGDVTDSIAMSHVKKELPGRTMEFTFDVSQTPIIGCRFLQPQVSAGAAGGSISSATVSSMSSAAAASASVTGSSSASSSAATTMSAASSAISAAASSNGSVHSTLSTVAIGSASGGVCGLRHASPRRSSIAPSCDAGVNNAATSALVPWRRPWQSQARVRECLVNLLNTCGQRVGLPKSPSVIFSQSSELERQSSMASSTEEVSGTGGADDRTPADDITSSENQFAVFKDFDFLEYELESQGEESVDNFNLWGVRRRSPSNSTAPNLGESATALAPSISSSSCAPASTDEAAQTPGTPSCLPVSQPEPSRWWEEDGSVSPVDDTTSNTDVCPAPSTCVPLPPEGDDEEEESNVPLEPPTQLSLAASGRAPSRSSLSDESSEGDLGDLTPCVATSALVFPTRPPVQPLHYSWRAHLAALTQPSAAMSAPAHSCALFSALFAECVSKTCSAVNEAAPLLGQLNPTSSALLAHLEAVGFVSPLPFVYLDACFLERCALQSRVRSSFIALHEHCDTFLDKLDTALMVLDTLKGGMMRVSLMSDSEESTASRSALATNCSEEQQVEVCRTLYRLHFQVSLLYDTYAKTLLMLLHSAKHSSVQVRDFSVELSALRAKLVAAAEQLDTTPPCSPPPSSLPSLPHLQRDLPEGEECETDSMGETDVCSLEEDVAGENTSSIISYYPGHQLPTTLPTPTHSSISYQQQPPSMPSSTPSTSSTLPLLATPTHSTASTLPTMPTLPQANHKVLELVANQKWREVVQYCHENSSVWHQPGLPHHNITTILNIYCTYLAEKQPGMLALCCTESFLSETSLQLSDANLSALSALRIMETEQQQSCNAALSSAGRLSGSTSHLTLYSSATAASSPHNSTHFYSTAANIPVLQQQTSPPSSQHSTMQSMLYQPSTPSSRSSPLTATAQQQQQSPNSSSAAEAITDSFLQRQVSLPHLSPGSSAPASLYQSSSSVVKMTRQSSSPASSSFKNAPSSPHPQLPDNPVYAAAPSSPRDNSSPHQFASDHEPPALATDSLVLVHYNETGDCGNGAPHVAEDIVSDAFESLTFVELSEQESSTSQPPASPHRGTLC